MLNIVEILASVLVGGFTLAYMMKTLSVNESISRKNFIFYTIGVFLATVIGQEISKPVQTILTITTMILLAQKLYAFKWIKALLSTLLVYIIIIISDILSGLLFRNVFHITSIQIRSNPVLLLISTILVASLSILTINIRNFSQLRNTIFFSLEKFTKTQKVLVGTYSILIMSIFVILLLPYRIIPREFASQLNQYYLLVFSGYLIATILFIYINYNLMNERIEHYRKIQEYEELKLYTKIIEGLSEDIRSFKHDYNNVMHSIEGYITENDMEGLNHYFYEEIMKEYKRVHSNNYIYSLKHIENTALKGLLTSKINQGLNIGINVQLEIFETISEMDIETLDLCKILGILLDNAIEESINSIEKKVSIGFMGEENSVSIIVGNSYKEKPNIANMFAQNYSTKGENRGFGLYFIKKLVDEKYNSILINSTLEDDMFYQEVIIHRKESIVNA